MSTRYGDRGFDRYDDADEERYGERSDERNTGRDYDDERSRYGRGPEPGATSRGYGMSREDYTRDDVRGTGSDARTYGTRGYGREYGPRYGREERQAGGYTGPLNRNYGGEYGRDRGREVGHPHGRDEERGGVRSFDTDYGRTTSRFYGRSGYDYGRDDYDEREGRERGYGGGRDYERDPRVYGERGRGGRGWWDRAADEVLSWFGDEGAEHRRRSEDRGAGAYRGRGPKNYRRSDERIRDDINDRLTDNDWLDASDVDVSVHSGEVILSGTVDSRYAKRLAEDIADSVTGVNNVQNNLRVVASQGAKVTTDLNGSPGLPGTTGELSGATEAADATDATDLAPNTGRASRAAGRS
jgi:osmotically-inducible protein OsmY